MHSLQNPLSFSMLQAFWLCPRLYHYRYLECLPGIANDSLDSRAGSRLHEQLHHDFLGIETPLSTDPEYELLWQQYQAAIAPYQGWDSRSEWRCHLPFTSGEQSIWLTGQLDRLYFDKDTAVIMDWKTGSPGLTALPQLQMQFYAWLLWQNKSLLSATIQRIETQWHYLNRPNEVTTAHYGAQEIAALDDLFNPLIQTFLSTAHPEVPEPRSVDGELWCKMCEYNRHCPEGRNHA